jgi:hypothetical protein
MPACPRCGQRLAPPAQYADADPNLPPWIQQLQAEQQPYAPTIGSTGRAPAPQPGYNPAFDGQQYGMPMVPPQPPGYQPSWPGGDPNGAPGGMPPARGNGNAGWAGQGMGQPPAGRMDAGQLFDESALPEWLREMPAGARPGKAPGMPQVPQGAPAQPIAPSPGGANAFPSIEQAGQFQPGAPEVGGMPARALVDSGALPQWLGGQAAVPAQQAGAMPGSQGLPAQSLVDEQALPQWLRAQADNALPPSSSVPRWGADAARDGTMPSWGQQPLASPSVPAPGVDPAWPVAPASPQPAAPPFGQAAPAGQMSAGQFIDESALPEWLKAQGGPPERPAAPANGYVGASANGDGPWAPQQNPPAQQPMPPRGDTPQGRFAASDLIDPNALPGWVRGGEGAPAFSSASGWANPQQPAPAGGEANGRAMPAAGRPDPLGSTELPTWLREPPTQGRMPRQNQGYAEGNGYGGNGDDGWDDPHEQGYGWDEADPYGGQGGGYDPYDQRAAQGQGYYPQGDYRGYPQRAGYGARQQDPRYASQADPRRARRQDDRPRGWRALFRRK